MLSSLPLYFSDPNLLKPARRFYRGRYLFQIGAPQPPVIIRQPAGGLTTLGTTASFSVSAAGDQPLYYRWRKDGNDLLDGDRISGAMQTNLSIFTVTNSDSGNYAVVVTNASGSLTSAVAVFTIVLPPPQILLNDGSFGIRSNKFGFNLTGATGQLVIVEASTDLLNWNPLQTNTLNSSPFYFSDQTSSNAARRFYRARLSQ